MRKMIAILCKEDGYIGTDILTSKAGFKNRNTLSASKRRLNRRIRKDFNIAKAFIEGEQGEGYRISESFIVLENRR